MADLSPFLPWSHTWPHRTVTWATAESPRYTKTAQHHLEAGRFSLVKAH